MASMIAWTGLLKVTVCNDDDDDDHRHQHHQ